MSAFYWMAESDLPQRWRLNELEREQYVCEENVGPKMVHRRRLDGDRQFMGQTAYLEKKSLDLNVVSS